MLCASRRGFICPTIKWKGKAKQSLALDGVRRISSEAKGPDGEPLFPALPENCFRHSYISHAVAASGDIPRVSLNAGNSVKEVNRHYRELVTEEEGKAWFDSEPGALGQVLPMEKTANS